MKVSVCIPNFNYEKYLGRTISSVLAQEGAELEIVIADNASTDRSVEIVRGFRDPRIQVRVNACNVGFAGNLDRAARMATGERMIMLSSDDLMRPGAIAAYTKLRETLGDTAVVMTSTMDQIDPDDAVTGRLGPDPEVWTEGDRDVLLSATLGVPVYRVAAATLLRRALTTMKNPFNFAATCYRRPDYERIEGYGAGRLINPDKWFHWRLLGVVDEAIWVDAPLFAYRWHPQNQTAQQAAQGALKYLVDEYATTLELSAQLLERASQTRDDVVGAFVDRDIGKHGLATLARGDRTRARRILDFGLAVYPSAAAGSRSCQALAALLATGPASTKIASLLYRVVEWRRDAS